MSGMDWDQEFLNDDGVAPDGTGVNPNSTLLKYPCKKCDKKYMTVEQLEEHITNVHKVSPSNLADGLEYTCNNCDFSSENIINMKNHVEVHIENISSVGQTKQAEYNCHNCNFKSGNVHKMRSHVKLHEQKVKCQLCNYESKDATEFIEHAVKNHSYQARHPGNQN